MVAKQNFHFQIILICILYAFYADLLLKICI